MTFPATTREAAAPRKFMRKIAFFSAFGGLLSGYDTGVINGALPFMRDDLALNPLQEGLVTSARLCRAPSVRLAG
jgi:major inositol transporter-like SP family MFS transporter